MLRVLVTTVLTLLLAMPQGMCLCPFEHECVPIEEHCCTDADAASHRPASQPAEDSDDHERDCPCKLRQILASDDGSNSAARHDHVSSSLACMDEINLVPANSPSARQRPLSNSSREPVPLIPCALRI